MEDFTFSDFRNFVREITDFSGLFSQMQESGELSIEIKNDKTPVTEIDFQIEVSIRQAIEDNFPDHSIIGEEFSDKINSSQCKWVIDPIDGTLSLTRGVPLFGTLLGFMVGSSPRYGSVRFPLLGNKLITGDGKKCFEDDKVIHATIDKKIDDALILTSDENRIKRSEYFEKWNILNNNTAYHRTWGDCYGYYLVCSGKAQVMFDIDLKPCDILPLIPVIQGAGCEIIELKEPFRDILVCSKDIYQDIIEIF